ncbi:uncharacterized protein LOC110449897 [Mizuhopecten yessoensis]|uniref:uncharacterized protein LOC110449897 n=1 Tax=Mizuhopecten yessoensis TaxID=6573 RepID=UPI000B45A7BE|nr:uncharacterized protein LOC110449897 [Mizuhopecten yessoensis]
MDPDINNSAEEMAFCRALTYWRDVEKRYISRQLMDSLSSTKTQLLAIAENDTSEAEEAKNAELAETPFHIKYHNNGQELFRVWMYSSLSLMAVLMLMIFGNDIISVWTCTECVEPCQQECQKYMSGSFWIDRASQYVLGDDSLL